jgi:hypothetical protein
MRVNRCATASATLVVALLTPAGPTNAQTRAAPYLDRVQLVVRELSRVDAYFVYSYRIANGAASRAGVALFGIDLAAAPGTGHHLLPATGKARHWASGRGTVAPRDHVPAGPITPDRWEASLNAEAQLRWYGVEGGSVVNDRIVADNDNVAPGAGLAGFGVRSTYLPGIRQFWAEPNWLACCSQPKADSEEGEHPNPSEFAVTGFVTAPTVPTSDLTINLLGTQLQRACELSWISHEGICRSLRTKLERAAQSMREGKAKAARGQLRAFAEQLEAQRGDKPGKHVNDNAYWLLRTNAGYLQSRL